MSGTRYYTRLAEGDKNGAYGSVAQMFDGMEVSEISKLCEESFEANMNEKVSTSTHTIEFVVAVP